MNREQFIGKVKELLQIDEELSAETYLFDIDEWDSLAMMNMVAFFDKEFNKKITISELQKIDTMKQLMDLVF